METPTPPQTLVPMSSDHQEIFRTLILGLQTLASTLAPSSSSAVIHPRVLDDLLSSSPLPPTEFLGNLVSKMYKLEEMFSVQEPTTTKTSQKRKVAEEDTSQVVSVVCDCCSWGGDDDKGLVAEPVTPPRVSKRPNVEFFPMTN